MQALQATDPSSPEQPSPPIAANLFNPICYGFFAPKNSSSKPPTPFPACLRVSVVSPAFVKSPDSEWHTPVKPATRERQIDIAEPGVSLGMYMCGTQAHSQATREHGSTQVEDTPKKNPAVATHAQGYAEQACTSPTVNCIPTPATHKRPKFSDDAALRGYNENRGYNDLATAPLHHLMIHLFSLQDFSGSQALEYLGNTSVMMSSPLCIEMVAPFYSRMARRHMVVVVVTVLAVVVVVGVRTVRMILRVWGEEECAACVALLTRSEDVHSPHRPLKQTEM